MDKSTKKIVAHHVCQTQDFGSKMTDNVLEYIENGSMAPKFERDLLTRFIADCIDDNDEYDDIVQNMEYAIDQLNKAIYSVKKSKLLYDANLKYEIKQPGYFTHAQLEFFPKKVDDAIARGQSEISVCISDETNGNVKFLHYMLIKYPMKRDDSNTNFVTFRINDDGEDY